MLMTFFPFFDTFSILDSSFRSLGFHTDSAENTEHHSDNDYDNKQNNAKNDECIITSRFLLWRRWNSLSVTLYGGITVITILKITYWLMKNYIFSLFKMDFVLFIAFIT